MQFDGDVLLFKPLPKRLTRHRLIAQSPDMPRYYLSRDMRAAQLVAGFVPGGTAYNAGLLGGNDVALVRAYAWAGLDLAQKFRGCPLNGTTTLDDHRAIPARRLRAARGRGGRHAAAGLPVAEAGRQSRLRALERCRQARSRVGRTRGATAGGRLSRGTHTLRLRVAATRGDAKQRGQCRP